MQNLILKLRRLPTEFGWWLVKRRHPLARRIFKEHLRAEIREALELMRPTDTPIYGNLGNVIGPAWTGNAQNTYAHEWKRD